MKVAFLVLNHRHPAQLVRLLETLRSQLPDSPIVVHHDVYREELPSALTAHIGNVHLLASEKRIVWGDFGLAEVYCWSLTWMREHLDFDWVVVLSAQDYPIKPLVGLADDLVKNGADAVFRADPISQLATVAECINARHRYFYQYRPRVAEGGTVIPAGVRALLRRGTRSLMAVLNLIQPLFKIYRLPDGIPYRFGWRAHRKPFNDSWRCWKGSSWFAMSRRALEYVLNYMSEHPEYVNYCSRTMHADESMIATIAFNSQNLRIANRDVTYTRWGSKTGHPDFFQAADLPDLLALPHYFARKFDIDKDSRILDELESSSDEMRRLKADGSSGLC